MSLEADLVGVVGPLLTGGLYPDMAPTGTAKPYGVYQQVGGPVINPVDNSPPGLRGARVQIIVWAGTRVQASALMASIEDALRAAPLSGRPEGAFIARYDEHSELRGAQQDFTFWHS